MTLAEPTVADSKLADPKHAKLKLADFTDVALCSKDLGDSYVAPGPIRLPEHLRYSAGSALQQCEQMRLEHPHLEDFIVEHEGVRWRVRRDPNAVDGTWFRLRRNPEVAPCLDTLPGKLPSVITTTLTHKALCGGGMVMIVGAPGAGKTHTGSATVVSRLRKFGGIAYTIENPPEHALNGWHGEGRCTQTYVDGDGWAFSLRGALRSQPANMPSMLFVGEIREKEAAEVALQAAASGFLVITTAFGQDAPNGIDNYTQMISADRSAALASLLKVVIHQQKMGDDNILASILVNPAPSSRVGVAIRRKNLAALEEQRRVQHNLVLEGADLWKEAAE